MKVFPGAAAVVGEPAPGRAALLLPTSQAQPLLGCTAGFSPKGYYPETGLGEINGDLLEADFWTAIFNGP